MSFLAQLSYQFALPGAGTADGSMIPAGGVPLHQLEQRYEKGGIAGGHLDRVYFDPQLYLETRSFVAAESQCTKLASYPWFGISRLADYDPETETLAGWKAEAETKVRSLWGGPPLSDLGRISSAVEDCLRLQARLGVEAAILPSPLTTDANMDYSRELQWLDAGIEAARGLGLGSGNLMATVALSDACIGFQNPTKNSLLDLIADAVSARGVGGVYLVLDQSTEPVETRLCSNPRTLWAILHLTHQFAVIAGIKVVANFLGPFGLATYAVGGGAWISGWYKSDIQLRLKGTVGGGRARPLFWSAPSALEINMDDDFDAIVKSGRLGLIEDETPSSTGLMRAAKAGVGSEQVVDWVYSPSNVTAARSHYYLSLHHFQRELEASDPGARLDRVSNWLDEAELRAAKLAGMLAAKGKTHFGHVAAWNQAFQSYRASQE